MDKVLDVFWAIRRDPVHYLQEESIWSLQHFLKGYSARIWMQGHASQMSALFREFAQWLEDRFQIQVNSHSVYEVVNSYARGPEHALDMLYALFEEFYDGREKEASAETTACTMDQALPLQDVCEIIRAIRKRPELYIGYPHFDGVRAYLDGHGKAGTDLGLAWTPDEQLFDDFKQWVEGSRWQQGKPRPWFKLVRFCAFYDCGLKQGSAYSVFFDLLDEFAAKIDRQGLFNV